MAARYSSLQFKEVSMENKSIDVPLTVTPVEGEVPVKPVDHLIGLDRDLVLFCLSQSILKRRALKNTAFADIADQNNSDDDNNDESLLFSLTSDFKLRMPLLSMNNMFRKSNLYFMCKRKTLKPTYFIHQGIDKIRGKQVPFCRRKYIPPRDVIEFNVCNGDTVWSVDIDYPLHNVTRRSAAKKDNWGSSHFLNMIQDVIQKPEKHENVRFHINPEPNISFGAMEQAKRSLVEDPEGESGSLREVDDAFEDYLILEIKEIKNNYNFFYIRDCVLVRNREMSAEDFHLIAKDLKMAQLFALCTAGKLDAAKKMYIQYKPFLDIDSFLTKDSWCILQHAAYHGYLEMVMWLVNDTYATVAIESSDGWNPLHCACKSGVLHIYILIMCRAHLCSRIRTTFQYIHVHLWSHF